MGSSARRNQTCAMCSRTALVCGLSTVRAISTHSCAKRRYFSDLPIRERPPHARLVCSNAAGPMVFRHQHPDFVVLLGLDAPGPRDSWTEGTPHFHSACYEGALSGIGGLAGEPSHTNNARRRNVVPGSAAPSRNATYVTGTLALFPGSPRQRGP